MIRRKNAISTPFGSIIDQIFQYEPLLKGKNENSLDQNSIALDIASTLENVIVRASLPGFSREEVDIQLHDGFLTIKAQHQKTDEHESERYYLNERFSGNLERRIKLPNVSNNAETKAELNNGVLTIHITLPESIKPQKIKIETF